MATEQDYIVLPVSALKDQVTAVFDALKADKTVYVSNHGRIAAAFRPHAFVKIASDDTITVIIGIALFAARGLGVAALHAWPMQPFWRYLSVVIDVLLLAAGASLWALLSLHPMLTPWLGTKLVLLLIYIVLGSFALKRGRTRAQRMVFFTAALAVVLSMAGIALAHDPAGWWA